MALLSWGLLLSPTLWLGLLTFGLCYWLYQLYRDRNLPPGPLAFPVIGNAIQLYGTKGELHEKAVVLGKKYGSVMTLHVGPMKMVILNDIEAIREAFVHDGVNFAGRPSSVTIDLFTEGGKDIAFTSYNDTCRVMRKLAGTAIRGYLTGSNLEKVVHQSAKKGLDRIQQEKGPINPRNYIYLITYNMIAGMVFSKSFDLEDADFQEAMRFNDIDKEYANGLWADIFPILWKFPLPENRKIKDHVGKMFAFFYGFADQHRDTFNPDNIRDLMDFLLLTKQQAEATEDEDQEIVRRLTYTHLVQVAIDVFGAGTDTTSMTLNWALLYLAGHPEKQQRVHEEIDAVCDPEEMPTLEQRQHLKYCEAVIFETMRIRPIAPLSVPHTTMTDVKFRGYSIPKDTLIMPNLWAVHHDPRYWSDSDTFSPETFMEERGGSSKPPSFLPFSTGRRVCLGEAIAKQEIPLVFACIMQRFSVSLPEGEKADYQPGGGALGLFPPPTKLVFTPRR